MGTRQFYHLLKKEFGTLAFCRRWIDRLGETRYLGHLKVTFHFVFAYSLVSAFYILVYSRIPILHYSRIFIKGRMLSRIWFGFSKLIWLDSPIGNGRVGLKYRI